MGGTLFMIINYNVIPPVKKPSVWNPCQHRVSMGSTLFRLSMSIHRVSMGSTLFTLSLPIFVCGTLSDKKLNMST